MPETDELCSILNKRLLQPEEVESSSDFRVFERAKIRDTLYDKQPYEQTEIMPGVDRDKRACRFDLERLWSAEEMNG